MPRHAEVLAELEQASSQVAALLPVLADRSLTSVQRRRALDEAQAAVAELEKAVRQVASGAGHENAPQREIADEDAVDRLRHCQQALDAARADLQDAVEAARAGGASWRRVGEALGIAAQSAHKRFDPRARRRHAEYMRRRYRPVERDL